MEEKIFPTTYKTDLMSSKDSVKVDKVNMQVTLTIAISDYLRIHEQKEPAETYKFKDNLPK